MYSTVNLFQEITRNSSKICNKPTSSCNLRVEVPVSCGTQYTKYERNWLKDVTSMVLTHKFRTNPQNLSRGSGSLLFHPPGHESTAIAHFSLGNSFTMKVLFCVCFVV